MNVNFVGWVAVCASVIAFQLAFNFTKPLTTKWRACWFGILGICGIPAFLFTVYYLHILPEWAWFYEMRSWRGSELLAIPLGAAAGCLATLLPRKTTGLVLLLTITTVSIPHVKPLLAPIPSGSLVDKWDGDACLQSTESSCGPASIATILRHLGHPASESVIARKSFTYQGGTEAWHLARHVRLLGLNARFGFQPGLTEDIELPALVGVRLAGFGHFIAVLSRKGDLLTVADPLHGMESVSVAELEKRCRLTGFHMSISNPSNPPKMNASVFNDSREQ